MSKNVFPKFKMKNSKFKNPQHRPFLLFIFTF